jgi:hypothetical protein
MTDALKSIFESARLTHGEDHIAASIQILPHHARPLAVRFMETAVCGLTADWSDTALEAVERDIRKGRMRLYGVRIEVGAV